MFRIINFISLFQCAHLSFDLRTIIDEKEELITERDAYKYKVNRISHELLRSLKANKIHPRVRKNI